jgi:hypothetical protein
MITKNDHKNDQKMIINANCLKINHSVSSENKIQQPSQFSTQ